MRIMNQVQFFMHNRIISAAKRVEFVSDSILFIIVRSSWCCTIVLNVHAQQRTNLMI
jgi:hypothetical protein